MSEKAVTNQVDSQQRMWAMWCHLAAFAGWLVPIGSILGPLVVWLTKRQEYPLVDREGKKALNFQITTAICFVFFGVLFFFAGITETLPIVILGIVGILGIGITWLVLVVLAAVRTNDGKDFNYPFSIRFLK